MQAAGISDRNIGCHQVSISISLVTIFYMQITVNNEIVMLTEQSSIENMIAQVATIPAAGIAIAVNQEVIPKGNWKNHILVENDNILIIQATQGG